MRKLFRPLVAVVALSMITVSAFASYNYSHHKGHYQNIIAAISAKKKLSTLVTAIKAAGLTTTLEGKGPFTLFAPTNQAFAKLPKATLDNLLKPENKAKLRNILLQHVITGKVLTKDLKMGDVNTINGNSLNISIKYGHTYLNHHVKVYKRDIVSNNGVIHMINAVILPKSN